MRIEIDTKKDSTDDIKKTIDFLLKFVENGSSIGDTPIVNEGSFNIFDNPVNSIDDKDDDDDDPSPMTIVEY
ncbi:MAG: hypothetical protein ABH828_00130 [archaeon]